MTTTNPIVTKAVVELTFANVGWTFWHNRRLWVYCPDHRPNPSRGLVEVEQVPWAARSAEETTEADR